MTHNRGVRPARWSLPSVTCAIAPVLFVAMLHGDAGMSARAAELTIDLSSRALQPGELVVVTLSFVADASDVRVRAFGKAVPTFAAGERKRRALVGIDVEQRPAQYELIVEARMASTTVRETRPLIVRPKTFATRTLKVSPDFVNPPAAELERIAREARLLREAYARSAPERLWQTPFVRPVEDPVSSQFGRRSVLNGEPRSPHTGTDFASPAGTPIKAPNAGRILLADDLYFSGTTVLIDHGLGLVTMFGHLSALDVRAGDHVTTSQVVGRVGATGRVTGAHLHWSVRVADARIDPLSALELLGESRPLP